MTGRIPLLPLALLALVVSGCSQAGTDAAAADAAPAPVSAPVAAAAEMKPAADADATVATGTPDAPGAATTALPRVLVYKSPTCGCCTAWATHMQQAGFPVEVVATDDLHAVRGKAGVPLGKASCHTAMVDGYFVEGHVPAEDVARLLRERPDARGLTVPGMPIGSPGMEVPSGVVQPYSVLLVGHDSDTTEFSRHGEP